MADYGDDAAALLAARGWESCLVMGISFGGMVAQELAIRHPACAAAGALACTSSGGAGGASIPFDELARLEGEARVQRQIEMMEHAGTWPDAQRAAEYTVMVEAMSGHLRLGQQSPEAARGAALQLEARRRHDTWDRLATIACPTLVCGGRYDGIAPQEQRAPGCTDPGSELALFDGGHGFPGRTRRRSRVSWGSWRGLRRASTGPRRRTR